MNDVPGTYIDNSGVLNVEISYKTNVNATNISVASPTPDKWKQQADEGNKAMQDIIDAVNK